MDKIDHPMLPTPQITLKLKGMIKLFRLFSKELLFPSKCLFCGVYLKPDPETQNDIHAFFCATCMQQDVSFFKDPYCPACGHVFLQKSVESHFCESCIKSPLRLGKVRAAVVYDGIIRKALPLFKYQGKLSLAPLFESWIARAFVEYFEDRRIDLIVPVPLFYKKMKQRGFNQAWILVRNLKNQLNKMNMQTPAPFVDTQSVIRNRMTAPQTGADITQRKKNLKGAFTVTVPDNIKEKNILVVDDVFTTGATSNELAKELLKNGAKSVDALVLARA